MSASSSTSIVPCQARAWPFTLTLIGLLGAVALGTAAVDMSHGSGAPHPSAARFGGERPLQVFRPDYRSEVARLLASQRTCTDFAIYLTMSVAQSTARLGQDHLLIKRQRQNLGQAQGALAGL